MRWLGCYLYADFQFTEEEEKFSNVFSIYRVKECINTFKMLKLIILI